MSKATEEYTFVEVVQALNARLYYQNMRRETDNYFTYETDGNTDAILFNGRVLWCSEEDTRTAGEAANFGMTVKFLRGLYNEYVRGLPKL